ncbi:transcription regulator protein BACH1b isoform X1 [Alosa pseudoharengus]|uniref:transcription regulator protein BACH1b isoform X1 n=2 Tax=Alosa pseudoharengus TaxID=34774 RepID=UPI003F89337A
MVTLNKTLPTMPVDSPRSSVFTFQSAVHSDHVLRCLDEQRRRDVLCDVTVVVDSRSFRAHRSVLASCSDYFSARFSSHGEAGAVISLPDEVTAEGFEPLLQFAYTTKLLFTKENILEIRNSATVLGFKNLDNSCFEFLIPKFFDNTKNATDTPRKQCCLRKKSPKPENETFASTTDSDADTNKATSHMALDEEEQQVETTSKLLDPPQQSYDDACPDMDTQTDYSLLCKYRKFQMACMEASGPEMVSMSEDGFPLSCVPCTSRDDAKDLEEPTSSKYVPVTEGCDFLTSGSLKPPLSLGAKASCCGETSGLSCGESVGPKKVKIEDEAEEIAEAGDGVGIVSEDEEKVVLGESHTASDSRADHRPGDPESTGQLGSERSTIEQEVAEHLAKGFWSEPCPSTTKPSTVPPNWLKQLDLGINTQDCPFLRDLGAVGARVPDCEEPSQGAQGSPYVSSQNSGEDSDSLDTEGDSEFYGSERACELPFSVERIASLSRNDFQQMLKLQCLTREQLDFVHDVRRRSKNRIAARRCRKRKLDCIHNLECEIEKLRTEKDKLTSERDRLNRQRQKTWLSISGLYERVCSEAALRPEQLQVLAKYSPSACPLFALLSPLSSTSAQPEAPLEAQDPVSACSLGLFQAGSCGEPSSRFAMDGGSGEGQATPRGLAAQCPPPASTYSGIGFACSTEGTGLSAFTTMRPEPVSKLITDK